MLRFVVSIISVVFLLAATTGTAAWFFTRPQNFTVVTTQKNDGAGSLRWAIDNAPSGSTITFAPNMAGQAIELTDALFIVKKQLKIQNQDAQREIKIQNEKSGIAVGPDADITMSGLAFTGGPSNPAALLDNLGKLTLTDSSVSGNTGAGSASLGGGIFNYHGTLTLNKSRITGNTASKGGGGGIFNYHGTLTLNNSSISDNKSLDDGGGIANNGTLTLANSTVSGNMTSNGNGGGIANSGTLTLMNSTVSGNSASGSGNMTSNGNGGGIANSGTLTLMNSTVSGNSASGGIGGGIANGSIFYGNGGELTLINSTVSDNSVSGNSVSAGNGGGVSNVGGTVSIVFCTIYNNSAAKFGGGLFIYSYSEGGVTIDYGSLTMENSLVAGNGASIDPDIRGVLTADGYNLIQDTEGVTFSDLSQGHLVDRPVSDIKIDPKLQLNGSQTTPTHALLPGSLAIDVIPRDACQVTVDGTLITKDQRGNPRPDGSENACDVGAYESSY